MHYRTLGTTGLKVSEIGFGCGGGAGLMVNGSFDQQLGAIERAIELGLNYFDESPDYGDGISEINLGKVLQALRVRPIITTKVEVRAENLDDIAGHVERSIDQSLRRLGVDYVDVVQIHNGPTSKPARLAGRDYRVLGIEDFFATKGALEGLERVRRAGKTRFIGFICRGEDGAEVRRLIDTGLFHIINLIYRLTNPTAALSPPRGFAEPDWGQVIPYAYQRGVGTAVYSPLAGGLLTDNILSGGAAHPLRAGRGERAQENEAESFADQRQAQLRHARQMHFLSQDEKQSMAVAAVRFILMEPGVTTVLGGFSDTQQVEEIASASGAGPLTGEQMARLEMVWRANFGDEQAARISAVERN